MLYVKAHFPTPKFESAYITLWDALWLQHIDISDPDLLASVLSQSFDDKTVREILAAAEKKEWKQALTENTKRALEVGAFGAPWFVVRNEERGEVASFWGSDR